MRLSLGSRGPEIPWHLLRFLPVWLFFSYMPQWLAWLPVAFRLAGEPAWRDSLTRVTVHSHHSHSSRKSTVWNPYSQFDYDMCYKYIARYILQS